MRRTLVALAVLAIIGISAAPAFATSTVTTAPATPAPKVTINGLVDNVTSWTRNMSIVDLNVSRVGDKEWYARTRVRPDITAEVGTTKFVLGLELDAVWGQTGTADNAGVQRSGATAGWDLNTDTTSMIEVKWAYTEFDMPWIPGARVRLGAQPFAETYKLAVLANGDYAGLHWEWRANPAIKLNFTFAQIEEESTGPRDGFVRGEDYAFIMSAEFSPIKGLDIRPIYAYLSTDGVTNGAARQGRGGIANASVVGARGFNLGDHEGRHTIGVDMRWKVGPFNLDPTVFYQFGSRDTSVLNAAGNRTLRENQDRSAWFIDVRGGWQAGPLLVEAAAIYTTGNSAKQTIANGRRTLRYFEPIDTDTSFYGGWAEVWALGIDYFNIINSGAAGLNPGVAIGYDKYGLARLGARASYAITPAFSVRGAANINWAAEKVDTNGTIAPTTGITQADNHGDHRYLGTEFNLGFTYRFLPNIAFDMVGSYMFAGPALASGLSTPVVGNTRPNNSPQDVQAVTARVRYTF
jgi:hypothetical protein